MKKIFFIISAVILIISCGHKESITQKEFEKIMKTYGYKVSRITDYDLIPPAEKTIAVRNGCKVEYLKGYSEGLFYSYSFYVHKLEDSKKDNDKSQNIKHDIFNGGSRYILETDSDIKLIRLKENMFIYADCPISMKKDILKIAKHFN